MSRWIRLFGVALAMSAVRPAGAEEAEPDAGTTVAILMFDGVQIIDFAAPYEVFGQAGFKVYTVSADGQSVTTAMHLSVNVDHDFESAPPADVVLVPGGDVHEAQQDDATIAWLAGRANGARHVLSICTGSYILASTGLLDGKSATTFHRAFDDFDRQFPAITTVRDQRWVNTGKLVTSAGLASGIDAALHVVAQIRGETAARSVALHLEYDWSPEQGFVRGLLADQHLRWPERMPEFPEGSSFDRISGVGDMDHWTNVVEVRSEWNAVRLMNEMAKAFNTEAKTLAVRRPDDREIVWEYESPSGGQWRLRLTAQPPEADGRYRVVQTLDRI